MDRFQRVVKVRARRRWPAGPSSDGAARPRAAEHEASTPAAPSAERWLTRFERDTSQIVFNAHPVRMA